jgi:two-component system cell cycle sensor histidine kinase/response regulator CckA
MEDSTHNSTNQEKKAQAALITFFAVITYFLVFIAIHYIYGSAMAIAAVIPVIVVSWFYGPKAGITAALLSFPVNIIMYELFGQKGLEGMLFGGGGLPGTLNLLLIGGAVGYSRDLAAKLRKELNERKKVEEELTEHRNKLNEMITLKTEELLEANRKLLDEKEFSNMVIETADVVITGVDLEGKINLFNRKTEEVTGYSREEVMGKDFIKVLLAEKGRTAFEILMQEIHEGGTIHPIDAHIMTKSGEERILLSRGTPFKNSEGEIIGVLGIGIDVTNTRRMEKQILQSEKLKSLGELAGGVAHDFNNVLAAILGRVQLLKSQIKTLPGIQEKRKSTLYLASGLETIERASLDGAETVRRIQEFSRKRTADGDYSHIDVNELLNNALDFTRTRWKDESQSKGIRVIITKELTPLIYIKGRPSELREVFTNLINNAIDAMPQGGEIRIKTHCDNGLAVIRIEDTGSGIPEEIKERIFDPFFTTKDVQSTGLGLSVSYGIINRHHGTITSDSVDGEGAAFAITLPVAKKTVALYVNADNSIPVKSENKIARILVIEDEEDIRHLLKDILTNAGHDVEIAANGREGIEVFEKKEFDLVFTDLGMPVMSGWQVAEKVKNINGKVPVALITGWNVKMEKSEMEDCGISLVIQKPFRLEQVLTLVQEGIVLRERFNTPVTP